MRMSASGPRQLRILYAAGPGDVLGTYRFWRAGRDDPTEVALTYSHQFFDACRRLNACAYVIAWHPRREEVIDGAFRLEHRPMALRKQGGMLFHIGQLWYGVRLIISALRFRANVAVISDGGHWFQYSLLSMCGVNVVPDLHGCLWPAHTGPTRTWRILWRLNRSFFRSKCAAALSMSESITAQINELTKGNAPPIFSFLPTFRRARFAGIAPPNARSRPFRVLFVGRMDPSKGVLDLLEICKRFITEGRRDIVFDLCGSGAALELLRTEARDAEIEPFFRCHGQFSHAQVLEMYGQSHVVVVPTRTSSVEGFNKVVVEAILAGRPVISSVVCPAVGYVRPGVVEVEPDDVGAYARAILELADNRARYEELAAMCSELGKAFHDEATGYGAALGQVLEAVEEDRLSRRAGY